MQNGSDVYDVMIIGGGPAGLSASQYTSRAKLKTVLIDKSASAGALAYSSKIENYPGLKQPVPGKELLDIMRKQAVDFGAEYIEAKVVGVNLSNEIKDVITMDKKYRGKAIIVATGAMGRKPTIKGESEFLGRGVSYCAVCDAAFFKGKTVCIIGSSEETFKEAGVLARFAETVYLISPDAKLNVENHSHLKDQKIKVLSGYNIKSIEGKEVVERIKFVDSDKREEEALEVAGVFVYLHGNQPVVDFLIGALETGEKGCIHVNRMMETSIEGIFAAGDVTCTPVRQVVVAASQGCIAALSAERYLYNRKRYRMDWGK
jgi:thioredoxin reductase (NADPH)